MDLSTISGLPMVEQPDPYAKSSSQEIDRDAFIKMFLAQMKHQDPLNPMDGSEFAAQLAQFTSLEQLYNVNSTLGGLKTLQEEGSRFEALALIGREIVAEGSTVSLGKDRVALGGFQLPGAAESKVTIMDAKGLPVSEIQLGYLEPGLHEFQWDGESASGAAMPEGAYFFKVSAVTRYGEELNAVPHITGKVDRVSLQGGNSTLYVGTTPVDMTSVLDVKNTDTQSSKESAQDPHATAQYIGV